MATTRKLYVVYALDTGKNFTLSLSDPKPGLDAAAVEPVAQTAVTSDLIRVGTAQATAVEEAYIREVTDTQIIE